MELYPDVLVSKQDYPELDEEIVSSYFFIRRTEEDIYPFLEKYKPLELIDSILPQTTKRDVFVLSVSLYGYFDEGHISLKVSDNNLNQYWSRTMQNIPVEHIAYSIESGFPLFLDAKKLYKHTFLFEDENYCLSFWHRPTIVNYWHFQLFSCDCSGRHLPREPKPGEKETKTEERKLRRLAISVLEYLISESICSSSKAQKFQCDNGFFY
ncbi:MAG: hypothetical protein LBI03_08160 [Clostridiales bacterium]|jgi:hypothetical protein|nr:hypothetical protein [Clostridiales bacterium]